MSMHRVKKIDVASTYHKPCLTIENVNNEAPSASDMKKNMAKMARWMNSRRSMCSHESSFSRSISSSQLV